MKGIVVWKHTAGYSVTLKGNIYITECMGSILGTADSKQGAVFLALKDWRRRRPE